MVREVERRNVNALKLKVTDELSRLYVAKRNQEMLQQVMDEMQTASDFVHEHGLYPSGWNNIVETYHLLKQQEEQQKQQSVETPENPKPDTPVKSKNTSKPLRH